MSLKGKSLKGKTLFITGASRGIGLAIALRAAREGANIAIAAKTDTPHPKLPGTIHTAAAEIETAGGRALPLAVDIRDEAAVRAAIEQAAARFGGIDIVVNNASAISPTPVAATRRLLRGSPDDAVKRIDEEAALFKVCLATSEARAAFAAFLDRKK